MTHRFTSRPALAHGIAASGSAVGGIVWPIAFQRLLSSIGFGWTIRVFTLIVLVLAVGSYYPLMIHTRQKVHRLRSIFPRHPEHESCDEDNTSFPINECINTLRATFKGRAYQFLCVGMFFTLMGYWVPVFYLVSYASRSLNIAPTYSSELLSIFNAASLFGRIIPAALDHKIGVADILLAGATTLGVLNLAWISVKSVAGITAWSIFLGCVYMPFP